jgi:hypothetical protein
MVLPYCRCVCVCVCVWERERESKREREREWERESVCVAAAQYLLLQRVLMNMEKWKLFLWFFSNDNSHTKSELMWKPNLHFCNVLWQSIQGSWNKCNIEKRTPILAFYKQQLINVKCQERKSDNFYWNFFAVISCLFLYTQCFRCDTNLNIILSVLSWNIFQFLN